MERLNSLLEPLASGLGPYLPRLLGGLAILALAWGVARIVRRGVERLGAKRGIDERLQSPGLTAIFANIAYWLIWLFALPALLDTLELQGLLTPVNDMMSRIFAFVPSLAGAAVVFGIGFLAARIVRQLITGVLTAAGSERLAARLGLSSAVGEGGLAGIVGSVAFVLILLPTLAAALQPLGLDAVTVPVSRLLETVIGLIPKLASAAIIIGVAVLIGRAVASIVSAVLAGVGFNNLPTRLGMSGEFRVGGRDASELAGVLVMAAVLLVALTQACEVLGFSILTEAVATLGTVLAKVAVSVVVLGVGLWLATLAARMIQASRVANARALGNIARGAILFFTAALALRQAGLPGEIVAIAFGSIVGSVAIGVAIALGVGGRNVAGRLLEGAAASFDRDKSDA